MHNLLTRMRHKDTDKIIGQGFITDFRDSPDWVFEHHIGWCDKNGSKVFVGDVCMSSNGRKVRVVWNRETLAYDFIAINAEGDWIDFASRELFEKNVEIIR